MTNEREREVLTWLARGKTAWEIGKILDISTRTVEWYVKSARIKLHAENTVHAVANAMKAKQIAPVCISIGCGMTAFAANLCTWMLRWKDIMGVPGGPA